MRKAGYHFAYTLLVTVIASTTACGFGPKQGPVELPTYRVIGNNPLFIDIEKNSAGEYVVPRFSNVTGMVKLNDLSPILETKDVACAGKKQFNSFLNVPECTKLKETFRDMKMNIGAYETPWYRYSTFDGATFTQAMNDALRNSKIDRQALLDSYDAYIQSSQDKAKSLYEQRKKQYEDIWSRIRFDFQIKDKSGYYSNELHNTMQSKISRTGGNGPRPYVNNFTGSKEDFLDLLTKGDKQLKDYEMELRNSAESYNVATYKLKLAFEEKGYKIVMADTMDIRATDENMVVPVEITIESKSFSKIYPPFTAKDKHVTLEFDGGKLAISNLSADYVKIMSVSVYYDHRGTPPRFRRRIVGENSECSESAGDAGIYDRFHEQRDYIAEAANISGGNG